MTPCSCCVLSEWIRGDFSFNFSPYPFIYAKRFFSGRSLEEYNTTGIHESMPIFWFWPLVIYYSFQPDAQNKSWVSHGSLCKCQSPRCQCLGPELHRDTAKSVHSQRSHNGMMSQFISRAPIYIKSSHIKHIWFILKISSLFFAWFNK